MLFYNHNHEFIGVDDEGLRLLNYSTLNELLTVCTDVADLFANQPGYIHNFKNFDWIDFLLHANVDASNAIVNANGRVFSCKLSVKLVHLCKSPTQNSYIIEMSHIKTMSGEEVQHNTTTPTTPTIELSVSTTATPQQSKPMTPSIFKNDVDITPLKLNEPAILDIQESAQATLGSAKMGDYLPLLPLKEESSPAIGLQETPLKDDAFQTNPLTENTLKKETSLEVLNPQSPEKEVVAPKKPHDAPILGGRRYTTQEQECLNNHHVDKNYKFDPQIAANELGLPVDLIEEFIGDFIQQAYDFKDELLDAGAKGDFTNLHLLSHKLKGVAANLRIEDALETLNIINTSSDMTEISANLKYYYDIISKLDGKELPPETMHNDDTSEHSQDDKEETPKTPLPTIACDDIYSFAIKHHEGEAITVDNDDPKPSEKLEETEASQEICTKTYLDIDVPCLKPNLCVAKEEAEKTEASQEMYTKASLDIGAPSLKPDLCVAKEEVKEHTLSTQTPPPREALTQKLDYNANTAAQMLGISPSFMNELLSDYKNDARVVSHQINQAIQAFETQAYNERAANFKGISDNLGLSKISYELAILSKTHDVQEAKKALICLNTYLDQLQEEPLCI